MVVEKRRKKPQRYFKLIERNAHHREPEVDTHDSASYRFFQIMSLHLTFNLWDTWNFGWVTLKKMEKRVVINQVRTRLIRNEEE